MKFLIDMNLSPLWVSFLSEKGLLLAIPHHQNAKAGRQIYGSVRIGCAGGAGGIERTEAGAPHRDDRSWSGRV